MGRFISRTIALFFVLLFIVVASASACTAAFRETLVNVETYKQILVEQDVYEDVLPYVIPALLRDSESRFQLEETFSIDLNDIDSFMSVADWRNVSEKLIPATWLQTQSESVLDTVNRISDGDFDQPENLVDATEIIERLQGQAAEEAADIIINSAPDCTVQQTVQLRQFDGQEGETFPICNPRTTILNNKASNIISAWFNQIGTMLDVQIREQGSSIVIPDEYARLIYNLFQLDSQLSLLLLLCPLTVIGFIMVFAVRNLKSFGRWLGWTFIITGIVTLFLIFTSQVPVFESFDEVVSASSDVERFEAQIYAGFMRSIYQDASNTMLTLSGGLIAAGFFLLMISLFGRSHNLIVPAGSMLVTPDGRVISNTTQQANQTLVLDDDS